MPIPTKFRRSNKEDFEFMKNEFLDLRKSIVRCLKSPLRAQAFVVLVQKQRLVIDFYMIVNLITSLNAYPFPNMEKLRTRLRIKDVFVYRNQLRKM